VATSNPYESPAPTIEKTPRKRPFAASGARILLVVFVALFFFPFFGSMAGGYLTLAIPELDLRLYDHALLTLTAVILGVVPLGTWMLTREPRDRPDKAPAWLRWGALGAAAVYACVVLASRVYRMLDPQAMESAAWPVVYWAVFITRNAWRFLLVGLLRHLASMLGETTTRRLANGQFVLWAAESVWFLLSDSPEVSGDLTAINGGFVFVMICDVSFWILLWSARRLERG
jgi:hypothetical protein